MCFRKKIKINHPDPGSVIPADFFVAFGGAQTQRVVGLLLLVPNGKPLFGETLAEPPHWSVAFDNVPPGEYKLVILDPANPRVFNTRQFSVTARSRVGILALNIGNVGNNSTQCDNYTAYGYASVGEAPLTGTMTGNSGGNTGGTVLRNPSNMSQTYAIAFAMAAPYDNRYVLRVTGATGASDMRNGITIVTC
jgi:hypothetical protein